MRKTASQIARSVLQKVAIDLSVARKATKKIPWLRSAVSVKPPDFPNRPLGETVLRRRLKQIPKEEIVMGYGGGGGTGAPQKTLRRYFKGIPFRLRDMKKSLMPTPPGTSSMGAAGGNLQKVVEKVYRQSGMFSNRAAKSQAYGQRMSSAEREMANRIGILHENVERRFGFKTPFAKSIKDRAWSQRGGVTHADPEVLLQEHNMLATLPKGLGGTRKYYQKIREQDAAQDILSDAVRSRFLPDFVYGEGTRIPRALRQRIAKHVREIPSPLMV